MDDDVLRAHVAVNEAGSVQIGKTFAEILEPQEGEIELVLQPFLLELLRKERKDTDEVTKRLSLDPT
jgi:hypothetical protein